MFGAAQRVFVFVIAVLLAVALLVAPAPAAAARDLAASVPAPTTPGAGAAPRPELERRMEQVVAAGAPGIVALINDSSKPGDDHDHARPWTDARGVADLRTGRPMRPHLRFRAGSVTKSFVAAVALQLVDEGRLSLSDTVERWLPGILPYGEQVTLRQLLNHTSGVPDYFAPVVELYAGKRFRFWQPRELVALVADQPQSFPAGSRWSYSNAGYVLAGLIVEQATGHRLAWEVGRRILRPLGLHDTSFPVNVPWIAGRSARGYSLDLGDQFPPVDGPLLDLTIYNPSFTWAAGNLVSDVDDIAHFYRALLAGRLLSPARLADMKASVETGAPGVRYGLGLFVIDTPCGPIFGHTGGIPGFANQAFSREDGSRQVGLMINAYFPPPAVSESVNLAFEQALREAFVGSECVGEPLGADVRQALQRGDLDETLRTPGEIADLAPAATQDEALAGAGQ